MNHRTRNKTEVVVKQKQHNRCKIDIEVKECQNSSDSSLYHSEYVQQLF